MELKNTNPSGHDVDVYNLHLMFLFSYKNIKNWVK